MANGTWRSSGGGSSDVDTTSPFALVFDGSNHADIGKFHPAGVDLGRSFMQEIVAKAMGPTGSSYWYAHGYGGAHGLLDGPDGGNIHEYDGSNESDVQHGGDYGASIDEVLCKGVIAHGGAVITTHFGVPDGYAAFTKAQRWVPATSPNARTTLGASGGHSGIACRIARLRMRDTSVPLDPNYHIWGYAPEVLGQEFPVWQYGGADYEWQALYRFYLQSTQDQSPNGLTGRGAGYDGKHDAALFQPIFGGESIGSPGNSIVTGSGLPNFVRDADFIPFATPAAQTYMTAQSQTPPGDALIFDDFRRPNQTFWHQERPSLGSTHASATYGALTWTQAKSVNGDTSRRDYWGILGGYAVPLLRNYHGVAYVTHASLPSKYRVTIGCQSTAARKPKTASPAFRVSNGSNYMYTFFDGSSTAFRIGRVVADAFDFSGLPTYVMPANWTHIVCEVDDTANTLRFGYRTSMTGAITYFAAAFSDNTFSGAKGVGMTCGGGDRFGAGFTRNTDFYVQSMA